jgi:hypothetical protein
MWLHHHHHHYCVPLNLQKHKRRLTRKEFVGNHLSVSSSDIKKFGRIWNLNEISNINYLLKVFWYVIYLLFDCEVFGVFICTKKLCMGFHIITNTTFNLKIVQFVIIIINMGKVVSSHFNPCEEPCVMSNHVLAHAATMGPLSCVLNKNYDRIHNMCTKKWF